MKNLIFRFKIWQVKGYPCAPKWYKNLSILWSKQEQALQRSIARTHQGIGEQLMTEAEFNAVSSPDVVELSIEGDMGNDTLFVDLKPIIPSWQEKLYKEEGIIV